MIFLNCGWAENNPNLFKIGAMASAFKAGLYFSNSLCQKDNKTCFLNSVSVKSGCISRIVASG